MAKASSQRTTRRAVLAAGLATAAAGMHTNQAAASLNLQPSELGRRMVALLPAHVRATWLASTATSDDESIERLEADTLNRLYETADAILDAARGDPTKHIADLAIARRCFGVASTSERREQELDSLLLRALLQTAGVDEGSCCQAALYQAVEASKAVTA
jgi:hypothetical protein